MDFTKYPGGLGVGEPARGHEQENQHLPLLFKTESELTRAVLRAHPGVEGEGEQAG